MKRFIRYSLAFVITIAIKGTYMGLLIAFAKSGLRGNTVSLNAHEHNAAAREALVSLHIPHLEIMESHISSSSAFGLAFLAGTSEVVTTLAIFFFVLWFVRLILPQRERSNQRWSERLAAA